MSFSQALSGLNASATNLEVIGNNIANSQTVGFKAGRTLFADVYAGAQAGLGTKVAAVMQTFDNGTLENTGRSLDIAITGEGFFRFNQAGETVYSRNGQLNLDASGYIVNAQGARLTGYPEGTVGADPAPVQVPSGGLQASATSEIDMTLNLDANSDAIAAAFDATNDATYSYSNNVTVYDSQGNAYGSTLYFIKTADNAWNVRMGLDGTVADLGNLTFDTSGVLQAPTNLGPQTFAMGGAVEDIEVDLEFAGTTQFGNDFEVTAATQNGYTSGSLVGVVVDDLGNLVGNYSNSQSVILSTLAIANFQNPEGLKPVGDNAWEETTASGQPLLGAPGTGRAGTVAAGVVESSNVDLTQELVNLIIAQRNYQANAQTIKVQDEVLQTAVNLG